MSISINSHTSHTAHEIALKALHNKARDTYKEKR